MYGFDLICETQWYLRNDYLWIDFICLQKSVDSTYRNKWLHTCHHQWWQLVQRPTQYVKVFQADKGYLWRQNVVGRVNKDKHCKWAQGNKEGCSRCYECVESRQNWHLFHCLYLCFPHALNLTSGIIFWHFSVVFRSWHNTTTMPQTLSQIFTTTCIFLKRQILIFKFLKNSCKICISAMSGEIVEA